MTMFIILRRLNRPPPIVRRTLSTQAKDATTDYETIIGLEVHAQLQTSSKLFSSASTRFLGRANSQVAVFDRSLPGSLPVLNRRTVELAVLAALALDCRIARRTSFDRKHYFYGDMPNGYQITQQFEPIGHDGHLDFIVYDDWQALGRFQPYLKRCRLKQIQIEQDSGKSLVDDQECNLLTGGKQSLIDLNRAGVPLLEFVFEPDLRSSLEAVSLVRTLVQVLEATNVCSCRMEEGALRIDANISIRRAGSAELGTRTEVKNLNSLRFIREAIDYEASRQRELIECGHTVINETMSFDFRTRRTLAMRDKEIVQDYRFMPEPNLPALKLIDSGQDSPPEASSMENLIDIAPIRGLLPRLPQNERSELAHVFRLDLAHIYHLMSQRELLVLFHNLHQASRLKNGRALVEFLIGNLLPVLLTNETRAWDRRNLNVTLEQFVQTVPSDHLAELIDLQAEGRISVGTCLDLVQLYLQKETRPPATLLDAFNWWLVSDEATIEATCRRVIDEYPKIARKFGKTQFRKPGSILIQRACVLLNNQVDESKLWNVYERLLVRKK